MSLFSTAYASTAATTHHAGQSMSSMLIFIAVMFAAVYLFIIRPQTQRAKAQRSLQETLKIGDKVMTIGGILATVTKLRGDNIVLQICEGAEITMKRNAIAQIVTDTAEDAPTAEANGRTPDETNNDANNNNDDKKDSSSSQ